MSELKICSQCHQAKHEDIDFYQCGGRWRSECKICTIKRNVRYQRQVKSWKGRYIDEEARCIYMREYYSKNKERFAQYRAEFKIRFPEYYREYFRKRKER